MLTVVLIFLLAAVVCVIMSAMGKLPLWIAVVLLCVVEAVQILPLR